MKVNFNRRKQRSKFLLQMRHRALQRLSVYRSNKHIYAQVICDQKNVTLFSASSLKMKPSSNIQAAAEVGLQIGKKVLEAGIRSLFFVKGPYAYHGRIAALVSSVRDIGIKI